MVYYEHERTNERTMQTKARRCVGFSSTDNHKINAATPRSRGRAAPGWGLLHMTRRGLTARGVRSDFHTNLTENPGTVKIDE